MTGISSGSPWRAIGWGLAALLLLLPLVAMQFTAEVNWSLGDFIFAGLMIGVVGLAFELTVRTTRSWASRAGAVASLAAGFLTIWVNGAVGMIGNEDNPYNLLFLGVVALAIVGAAVVRFRSAGLAWVMGIAALAQLAAALGGMAQDMRGGIFSAGFALIWIVAAGLFRRAAEDGAAPGRPGG